ncbi:MAG: ATPase [Pseudodesulfovibrio sp.]|nr:ATPase [Pseudodesulfovibrio sp.]
MLIDWFTVAAQAVNFLILVWILKRFLYGPILTAMAERKQRVAAELDDARIARNQAESDAEEMRRKLVEMEQAGETMLAAARRDAEQWKTQALAAMRVEMEERREQWLMALSREREVISEKVRHRIGEQVVRLSEKVLRDLAGDDLEARCLIDFVTRLAGADPKVRLSGDVVVRTGFSLSKSVLERLDASIREHFPDCSEIKASRDETLGFGIVMVVGDNKWEWNLASYLDDVETAVFAELSEAKAGRP